MQRRLIYCLYWLLQPVGFPFLLLYFLWRGLKDARYFRRLGERLGLLPASYKRTADGAIWLHAVSVGEVISSAPVLERLRRECPWAPLYVSATTLAGRAMADQKLADIADGVFYAPVDYRFAVRRVLRTLRPSAVVVLETEIWPNLYREVSRSGAALLIANGRISDRTVRRYNRLRWFFREVLSWPDAILAQSEADRQRYLDIGAPAARVRVAGNLKYDFEPSQGAAPQAIREFPERTRPAEIWIAASTMPPADSADVDEDDVVIAAFQQLARTHPGLLLMLVPRRPERFDAAADKLRRAGVSFTRRSALGELSLPGVLLVDSIGELNALYSLAHVVFMGGTLARRGGHNILEPAYFAKPVVVGPHMENFTAIAREFVAGGGVVEISSAAELAPAIDALLQDPQRCAEVGRRAQELASAKRGATGQVAQEIRRLYDGAVPQPPARWWLWPLAWLWRGGVRAHRAVGRRRCRLETPVISVGGISMGGSGKTPFVLWLAERLPQAAILTRGYGSGDEAKLHASAGIAAVGIGADRFETGRRLEQKAQPRVFLLDDGFQHWRLERDLDIVLIDALDPFGGGVFPLGRLREPPEALARADILVITRAARGRRFDALEQRLRCYNSRAPIFYSRVVPQCWVEKESGRKFALRELPQSRVAAFCGLGNPASFWQTCAELGLRPVLRREFRDHHRYRAAELESLPAEALITTEKDVMNLPPQSVGRPLYWLRIGIEVDDEADLIQLITAVSTRR